MSQDPITTILTMDIDPIIHIILHIIIDGIKKEQKKKTKWKFKKI